MYELDQIIALAVQAAEISKGVEANPNGSIPYKKSGKLPEYYPLYAPSVENMEAIRVHAEKGVFPKKIFEHRSPNQTQEEATYIEKTYKQVTLPVFMDYQSTISRAFNDANWSISYGDDKEAFKTAKVTFQSYVENGLKTYGSLENFIKSIVTNIKAIDAMGVIAIKPYEINTIELNGEAVIDPSEGIEPIPFYYTSKQIVSCKDDEYYMIELAEKSICKFANKNMACGKIYEFYDEQNIWRVEQYGNWTENTFKAKIYFQHNEGVVPVTRLKGVPKIDNGNILWQSPFLYAVDNLDLVAMNASNLQISITKCVYPYAILLGDECEFEETGTGEKCIGGYVMDFESNRQKTCPICSGSGLKSRMNAMGQMILKPANRNSDGEFSTTQKAIEYVSPPVDALEFLEKNIERNEARARQILHLNNTSQSVQFNSENKTATGSDNNQKALYAFVKTISDQTFEIYEFALDRIGFQRYGSDYQKTTLVYPQTFDFLTEQDYLVQISEASKAGLPPFVIHSILYRYLKAIHYNEKRTADVFNLIIYADRLLTLSNDDILLKKAALTVDKWEDVLHTSAITFIDQLITVNDKFFEQDLEVQKTQLVEMAKKISNDIKAPVPTSNSDIVKNIIP